MIATKCPRCGSSDKAVKIIAVLRELVAEAKEKQEQWGCAENNGWLAGLSRALKAAESVVREPS